jgi:hypothetical protein
MDSSFQLEQILSHNDLRRSLNLLGVHHGNVMTGFWYDWAIIVNQLLCKYFSIRVNRSVLCLHWYSMAILELFNGYSET